MPDVGLDERIAAEQESEADYREFVRKVMTDVYALLDYLSGRAKPSLESPRYKRPHQTALPDQIDEELDSPTALVQRAMSIGESLGGSAAKITGADAAFLVRARDLLNRRAAPATGASIVFTLLVVEQIYPQGATKKWLSPNRPVAVHKDEFLQSAARKLALHVRLSLWGMVLLLCVTVLLSTYVAWGKLLLDTRDAVNRDYGANQSVIAAEMAQPPQNSSIDLVADFCRTGHAAFLIDQSCRQYSELEERRKSVSALIAGWDNLVSPVTPEAHAEQWATTAVGVIGNYLLPVFYGAVGSIAFVLRQFNQRLADRCLTPRDRRANHIRIVLGTMTGACIGLFVNNSAAPSQTTGLGGAAVTLSASAIAFLAGYGVEAVFKTLDALLNHVFRLNQAEKDAAEAQRVG